MICSSTNHLKANGYSEADIAQMVAARKAVDDYMRGTVSRAEAQAKLDGIKTKPWFKYLYMGETFRDREVSGWRKERSEAHTSELQSLMRISYSVFCLKKNNNQIQIS